VDEPITPQPAVVPDAASAPTPTVEGLAPGMTIVRVVRGPRRWPGILACILAVLMLVATGVAIQLSAQLNYSAATIVAYLAIALSVAAIVAGLIAIFGRWARAAGVVGLIVGVLGNPLVLNYGLNYLAGK
jgi:uncharacterized integral membrane protein